LETVAEKGLRIREIQASAGEVQQEKKWYTAEKWMIFLLTEDPIKKPIPNSKKKKTTEGKERLGEVDH